MGLSRGLLLMLSFCMVEIHSRDIDSKQVYHCVYIEELYQLMRNSVDESLCVQSQLSDASRIKLTQSINLYRVHVSKGRNAIIKDVKPKPYPPVVLTPVPMNPHFGNVFKLNYHWVCEFIAAYFINHNLPRRPQIHKQVLEEIVTYVESTLDTHDIMGTLNAILEYDFTVEEIYVFNAYASSQIKLMNNMLSYAFNLYTTSGGDPFLKKKEADEVRMWPGTSYFGCVIYYEDGKKPGPQIVNRLLCVFATHVDADRKYEESEIGDGSCLYAKPPAVFDPVEALCVDKKMYDVSAAKKNVPCQFFYDVEVPSFMPPQICNDSIDPKKYPEFWESPRGFLKMEIYFHGNKIPLSLPIASENAKKGDALKLHSIQIYLVVFIALISSTFSQLFSSYT